MIGTKVLTTSATKNRFFNFAWAALLHLLTTASFLTAQELTNKLADQYLQPVWQGDVVYGESAVLFQEDESKPYILRLAFPVEKVISIESSNRQVKIPLDKITVDAQRNEISISPSLKLNGLSPSKIFLPPDSPNSYRHRKGHPDQWMLYGPGRWFHDRQVEVTYQRKPYQWSNPLPKYDPKLLPKTISKLKNGGSLTIGVSGDSITTGLDSSSSAKVEPNQPGYVELFAHAMRKRSKAEIKVENRAVAGWSVATGLEDLKELLKGKPDLILIAYGMNDVGRRDPEWYGKVVDQMLSQINLTLPETEVILVSTMVGSDEWIHTPREMFGPYRDQLTQRVRPGVALADVTALWEELLKHKHDHDLTGNGLNHPNDFGHRLYAQAILALLAE
jgi:acyl-CoA thioesterase I